MLFLLLFVSWIFVFGIMWLSGGQNARPSELKVLFFFLSSARVILGSSAEWIEWLRVLEGSAASAFPVCVLPLDAYNVLLWYLFLPLLCLLQLAVTVLVYFVLHRFGVLQRNALHIDRFYRTATMLVMFRHVEPESASACLTAF